MRISDWSSDVCSSDLAVDGIRYIAELDGELALAGLRLEPQRQAGLPADRAARGQGDDAQVEARVGGEEGRHDGPRQAVQGPGVAEQADDAGGSLPGREHGLLQALAAALPLDGLRHGGLAAIGGASRRERVCQYG